MSTTTSGQMYGTLPITAPYINPGTEVMATVRVTPPLGLDSPCAHPGTPMPYWTVPPTGGMSAGTFYVADTNRLTW